MMNIRFIYLDYGTENKMCLCEIVVYIFSYYKSDESSFTQHPLFKLS